MNGQTDGWMENNDFTKQRMLSLSVLLLLSLCLGVTFLRPRHTAKHTPSVLVIYRLAIDVLQSELGGDRHAHGSIIHGDTVKCSRPGEKKAEKPPAPVDVNTTVMLQLTCGNDFF